MAMARAVLMTALALILGLLPRQVAGVPAIRIAVFGESVSQGFVPTLLRTHPYTLQLKILLRQHGYTSFVVDNFSAGARGVIVNPLLPHIYKTLELNKKFNGKRKYNMAIINLGILDLNRRKKAADIMNGGLYKLYDDIVNAGMALIAMPPLQSPNLTPLNTGKGIQRLLMVKYIGDYVRRQRKAKHEVWLVDTEQKALDFHHMSQADLRIWMDADQLHLSYAGYDKLGTIVANLIFSSGWKWNLT